MPRTAKTSIALRGRARVVGAVREAPGGDEAAKLAHFSAALDSIFWMLAIASLAFAIAQ